MATFTFTSPDGHKYTVRGPDGATADQAFQILQQQLASGAAPPPPQSIADQIPESDEERAYGARQPVQQPSAPADPSLVDRIVGGGETALSLATGATTGAVGALGGALAGIGKSVADGTFGTQQGVQTAEQAAAQGMNKFTYSPRTGEGQRQTEAVGNLLDAALPATPLTAEMGALGEAAGDAAQVARNAAPAAAAVTRDTITGAARDAATATANAAKAVGDTAKAATNTVKTAAQVAADQAVDSIRSVSPAIADRVERTLARNPEPPTPGTKASGGGAGTDMATQRQQVADQVGVDLTSGQLTRDPQQLRFEQETAKGEQGSPIRDRYSDQNEQIGKHFDDLVDMTGKQTADLIGTGRSVDQALRNKAAQDKARIRVAYKEADKSGEMAAPVILDGVIQHINDNDAFSGTAPILADARRAAIKTGIAAEGPDSQLVAQPTTLKMAEEFRKNIGAATNFDPPNVRQSAIMKGLIDSATNDAGGDMYRAARRMRENYAKQYEDRGVIASLLNNKKGTADRKVALEDVFAHSILNASRNDVAYVRRALTAHPKDAAPEVRAAGQQAWKDLQGETINWIKDQAFSNTATDQRGNVILSVPKLDRAIKKLDADRRLDTIFGKERAQHLRDINDLARVIYTVPPGSVNTSNTASVLLAALSAGDLTISALAGLPAPVLNSLRLLAKHAKNRQIQKRIEQALHGRAITTDSPPARPAGATLH